MLLRRLGLLSGGLVLPIVLLLALGATPAAEQGRAAPGDRVIAVTGVVPGSGLTVEILAVVPAGRNASDVAAEVLAAQGARPIAPSEYSTTGLRWPQFANGASGQSVVQNYNGAGSPLGAAGRTALTNSQATWSAVAGSNFAFSDGGDTNRCPSLVQECPGPQKRDGFNDVAWMSISGCCTLAVTWSTTSGAPEADMAMNTRFAWTTTGAAGAYDAETVFLHENGHVAGLGHSDILEAVMYPSYQGLRRALHADDIAGLVSLYPASGGGGGGGEVATSVSVTAVNYSTAGGRNQDRDLRITVVLRDNLGAPVSGASVSITVSLNGSPAASGSATTGSTGEATFQLKNAPSGTYTTTVTSVTATGLAWDGITPPNSFTK